jgi:hypothetical protein
MTDYINIKNLNNIIVSYALNNLDNIDLDLLRKSLEKSGNEPWQIRKLTTTQNRLGGAQKFKITSIKRTGDLSDTIKITTKPLKYTVPRIELNCNTVKDLYKSLLSVHGLKGSIKVTKKGDNFITKVTNLKKNTYEEIYIPFDDFTGRNLRSFTKGKYDRLSEGILAPDIRQDLEEIFNL